MKLSNFSKILCVVIALLLGTGWEPIPEDQKMNNLVENVSAGDGGTIYIRYLPDGTKCAVLKGGFRRGGIDCDWAGDSEKRHQEDPERKISEEDSYYER